MSKTSGISPEIERLTTVEEFSIWLTDILHRFINYSFDFTRMKHSDVVYRVMEYVKVNYRRRITLDELAGTFISAAPT